MDLDASLPSSRRSRILSESDLRIGGVPAMPRKRVPIPPFIGGVPAMPRKDARGFSEPLPSSYLIPIPMTPPYDAIEDGATMPPSYPICSTSVASSSILTWSSVRRSMKSYIHFKTSLRRVIGVVFLDLSASNTRT